MNSCKSFVFCVYFCCVNPINVPVDYVHHATLDNKWFVIDWSLFVIIRQFDSVHTGDLSQTFNNDYIFILFILEASDLTGPKKHIRCASVAFPNPNCGNHSLTLLLFLFCDLRMKSCRCWWRSMAPTTGLWYLIISRWVFERMIALWSTLYRTFILYSL